LLRQVLAPFVLLQALCVWGWWMSAGEPFAYVRFALGMGAASALALVGCFAGGQLERRLALFSRLARTREARRSYYERLEHPGDAGTVGGRFATAEGGRRPFGDRPDARMAA
jgi:hypothetical protein